MRFADGEVERCGLLLLVPSILQKLRIPWTLSKVSVSWLIFLTAKCNRQLQLTVHQEWSGSVTSAKECSNKKCREWNVKKQRAVRELKSLIGTKSYHGSSQANFWKTRTTQLIYFSSCICISSQRLMPKLKHWFQMLRHVQRKHSMDSHLKMLTHWGLDTRKPTPGFFHSSACNAEWLQYCISF